MASAAHITNFDRLGEALADQNCERLSLTWSRGRLGGGHFFVEGRDGQGRYMTGVADTPDEALSAARRNARAPGAPRC